MIDATEGMTCIAQYGSCEDMLADIQNHQPDVILQDIGLPGMCGIDGVKEVRKILEDVVILMLTVYEDEDNVFESLKAGASGYLLKKTQPVQLIEAIQDAEKGGSPMSSSIARKVVSFFQKKITPKENENTNLSNREIEILESIKLVDENETSIISKI